MSKKESLEAFNKLLSAPGAEKWKEAVEFRKANKDWLRLSADIAIRVLGELDRRKMTQKGLAERMGVTPQQVNKILKGRENLKLETIAKLQQALGVQLIAILDEDETVVKNDLKSMAQMLTTEMLKQRVKMKKQKVLQQTQEVRVPEKAIVHKSTVPASYVTVPAKAKAGAPNYATIA